MLPLLLSQPALELPPDVDATTATPSTTHLATVGDLRIGTAVHAGVDDEMLMKGLQGARLATESTTVGGYAQLNASLHSVGPGANGAPFAAPVGNADVRRLVLFLAHSFAQTARFYTELEWEHAIACRTCDGAVEIEQAFVELDLVPRVDDGTVESAVTARAGLLLIPIGIINQWHEPPVFHGVDRPRTEEVVIPSTWRELGGGITGSPVSGITYELYLTTGLDPLRFQSSGIGAGRQNGSFVDPSSWMLSGRVEVEPRNGFLVGVSGLGGDTGGGVFGHTRFADAAGAPVRLALPLLAAEADARVRKDGLEARALVAGFAYPNAGDLMAAKLLDGSATFVPPASGKGAIATRMLGAQIEVAYDVLRFLDVDAQLLPFVRADFTDTQSAVPDGFVADPAQRVRELTVGVSYRPLPQIVVKADAQLRNRFRGLDEGQVNLGLGLMF